MGTKETLDIFVIGSERANSLKSNTRLACLATSRENRIPLGDIKHFNGISDLNAIEIEGRLILAFVIMLIEAGTVGIMDYGILKVLKKKGIPFILVRSEISRVQLVRAVELGARSFVTGTVTQEILKNVFLQVTGELFSPQEQLLREVCYLESNGQYEGALQLLSSGLKKRLFSQSYSHIVFELYGRLFLKIGQLDKAEGYITSAVAKSTQTFLSAKRTLADFQRAKGDLTGLKETLTELFSLSPHNQLYKIELGTILVRIGEEVAGVILLKEILKEEVDEEVSPLLLNAVELLVERDLTEIAGRILEKISELPILSLEEMNSAAIALRKTGDFEASEKMYQKILPLIRKEDQPKFADIYYNIAVLYVEWRSRENRMVLAREYLEEALGLNPDHSYANNLLAKLEETERKK